MFEIGSMETVVHWHNYFRRVCLLALKKAPPMGGPGEIIEIDESLMHGHRKYSGGRLLQGNQGPPARENYGHQVGPWVFGLVWKKPNGTSECHCFHVLQRNEGTLCPIIQVNVAAGSTIILDEW